jgi:hypothetical protein
MKKLLILLFYFTMALLTAAHTFATPLAQDDTVRVREIADLPVVDGKPDDRCWQDCTWQAIDQVWIEYGQTLDSTDFTGRYKIAWSSSTHLLYFLVEIVDDAFVDGYVYNSNPSQGGGYPDYDIVEVFIDHDKSGGLHVFDGTGNTATNWGSNAENAFSYHIATDLMPDGQATTEKVVCDIAGKNWGDYFIPDYSDHLPDFAMRQAEGKYVWEFSLQVYDHSYHAQNPSASRVTLQPGDIMGLSLAYCDNDDPDEQPKKRDHFIGSVWVPEQAFNDHWKDADGFGTIQLLGQSTGVNKYHQIDRESIQVFPNPSHGSIQIRVPGTQEFDLAVYNLLGHKVYEKSSMSQEDSANLALTLNHLPNGLYFLNIKSDYFMVTRKITLVKNK